MRGFYQLAIRVGWGLGAQTKIGRRVSSQPTDSCDRTLRSRLLVRRIPSFSR